MIICQCIDNYNFCQHASAYNTALQIICIVLQTDNDANTSSFIFAQVDAFPDAQSAVWKHGMYDIVTLILC